MWELSFTILQSECWLMKIKITVWECDAAEWKQTVCVACRCVSPEDCLKVSNHQGEAAWRLHLTSKIHCVLQASHGHKATYEAEACLLVAKDATLCLFSEHAFHFFKHRQASGRLVLSLSLILIFFPFDKQNCHHTQETESVDRGFVVPDSSFPLVDLSIQYNYRFCLNTFP